MTGDGDLYSLPESHLLGPVVLTRETLTLIKTEVNFLVTIMLNFIKIIGHHCGTLVSKLPPGLLRRLFYQDF